MASQISLIFNQKFYFFKAPSIFSLPENYACVYLWGVEQTNGTYLIHYIGQTQNIKKRFLEHLQNILGFNYAIFDVNQLQQGELKYLWKGFWRTKLNFMPSDIPLKYKQLNETVISYINHIAIFPSSPIKDQKLRLNIEGHLAKYLRKSQYSNIYPLDQHTGIGKRLNIHINIKNAFYINGLPTHLSI